MELLIIKLKLILLNEWDKSYDDEKEFEIEGAYDNFTKG